MGGLVEMGGVTVSYLDDVSSFSLSFSSLLFRLCFFRGTCGKVMGCLCWPAHLDLLCVVADGFPRLPAH